MDIMISMMVKSGVWECHLGCGVWGGDIVQKVKTFAFKPPFPEPTVERENQLYSACIP